MIAGKDGLGLAMGADFERMLETLSGKSVDEQHRMACAYRRHPALARRILEQAGDGSRTRLLLLACQLATGGCSTDLVQRIEPLGSAAFDILKGCLSLRRGSYDNALFLFRKAGFRLGMQMCSYYLGNLEEARRSDNGVVRAYCLLREGKRDEAVDLLRRAGKRDLVFRLGGSEEHDGESVDVRIGIAERRVREGRFADALEMLGTVPEDAETLYLRGKMEHVGGNVERARRYFEQSLECDGGYFLSEYSLQRIVQSGMRDADYSSEEFCDFRVYLKLRRREMDVDLSHCSREFRDAAAAVVDGHRGSEGGLRRYLKIAGGTLVDDFVVRNNIAYFLCRHMVPFEEQEDDVLLRLRMRCDGESGERYLRDALETCPEEYRELVQYNLGYVTEDPEMLKGLSMKEARILVGAGGEMVDDVEVRGYQHLQRGECGMARRIFEELDSVYGCVSLGNMELKRFWRDGEETDLDRAMEMFSRRLDSYYCASGIGICLVQRGRHSEAMDVFAGVSREWEGGFVNLGNVLVLCGRYREAVEMFLRAGDRYSREMCIRICRETGDVECCRVCVDGGMKEVERDLFAALVESGCMDEAGEMDMDEEMRMMYRRRREEIDERSVEHRRKMEAMNEYRKRRR